MLTNKKILLCVTGGIAVYKAAALTSKLVQAGAQVKVIITESASQFVTPLTFQALSRNEVYTDTFDEKNPQVIAHIDLADWADLVLVAPATANTIAKLAGGIADNMVTTTLLATTAPVWIAPAMNVHMYDHPAVKKNLDTLADYGYRFIEPSEGYLACGYVGKGRLEEPEKIVELIQGFFAKKEFKPLKGKTVVITAGPTREKIDPVRFISNHSSGKMGYSIAEEARKQGARVVLISGPVQIPAPSGVDLVKVESAEDMYKACIEVFDKADIVIKTAAVADYRPKIAYDEKVKKQPGGTALELERTKDILFELGQRKKNQVLIGFAAETNNVDEYARKKLLTKNADMIVANNVKSEGAGFGTDTNIVTLYKRDGSIVDLPLMSKADVAGKIIEEIAALLKDLEKK
ncbi:bifunctional phosphopantothenoylcysteine decarboxylase/phosphopantothenate--cysteine ligase CoaBC [Neobacillus citreus]|uniref:Coenzyme A biosynthesis bifunctional protein CoaBC n=1 Tax=Neobacillus citreus TaxID=2833578 RepID=A0A942SVH3_9BACI|nr:bifunctional phosphopantothenoylcysteine decarboxylase/phosphopantothenate--cysteine ligase CoaBC [Neobacillus citreus]MCH6268935.1 bifunctional phosphopantothenoylcysteine decarboxylase/phosphopantothenate--cysteine ligase CoaBC [Neobacillus citreus]